MIENVHPTLPPLTIDERVVLISLQMGERELPSVTPQTLVKLAVRGWVDLDPRVALTPAGALRARHIVSRGESLRRGSLPDTQVRVA